MRGAWVDESNGLGVLFESAAGNGVIVVHSLNPFEEGIDLAEAFVRGEADDFEHRPAPRAADPDEDGPRVC